MNVVHFAIIIWSLTSSAYCENLEFPKGFLFGAGSSAYQIEGAWNVSGKSENIWDDLTHYRKHLMFMHTFIPPKNDNSESQPIKMSSSRPVSKFFSGFVKHVNKTVNRLRKFTKMDSILACTQQWYDGEYTQSIPLSSVLTTVPSIKQKLSVSFNHEKEDQTLKFELPRRPPMIKNFFKGVPIYESLPDNMFRTLLGLPSESEMSDQILYSMYTQTRGDLDSPTGDVACDSYNKFEEDIELLKDLGAKVYRFSLSWSRLYPKGNTLEYNQDAVDYYNKLIDKLLQNNIQPYVTIHHFDLPRHLQMIGGWANKATVFYYAMFADFVFNLFGDRVKLWTTINEPSVTIEGYKSYNAAPAFGQDMSGVADYLAINHIIIAHARAYEIYKKKYKSVQNGKISVNVAGDWFYPLDSNKEEDKKAAEAAILFQVGIILHPLTYGDYPEEVRQRIHNNSMRLNITNVRFQEFTDDEKQLIKNSYDFISLNHYMTFKATNLPAEERNGKSVSELDTNIKKILVHSSEELQNRPWCKSVPEGMSSILKWIDKTYNHPDIFISENGYPEPEGIDLSLKKVKYHHDYLNHTLIAINEYNVSVIGYSVWSLMDSMEWLNGYRLKYGIYSVDFNDDNRPRTSKSSTQWFSEVFKSGKLIDPFLAN